MIRQPPLADIGYGRLGVEDLVSLRNQGVSPEEIRRAKHPCRFASVG